MLDKTRTRLAGAICPELVDMLERASTEIFGLMAQKHYGENLVGALCAQLVLRGMPEEEIVALIQKVAEQSMMSLAVATLTSDTLGAGAMAILAEDATPKE